MSPLRGIAIGAKDIISSLLPLCGASSVEHPKHFYYETYEEITANLTPEQKTELEYSIVPEGTPAEWNRIMDLLTTGVIDRTVFDIPSFHLYALKAFKCGLIDGMTFTTSQLFYNAYRNQTFKTNARFIPLFIDQAINPEAWNIIVASSDSDHLEGRAQGRTREEIARFFELMREAPPLNRQFMLLPNKTDLGDSFGSKRIVNDNYKLLTFHNSAGNGERIINSKAMFQAILTCRGGASAPFLITRFLLSPVEQLESEMLENKRDFCLNFAGLTQVTEADGVVCDLRFNEVEMHDGFHGEEVTSTPVEVRKILYGMARISLALAEKQQNPELKQYFMTLRDTFVDMDNDHYLNDTSQSVFKQWCVIWGNIFAAKVSTTNNYNPENETNFIDQLFTVGEGKLFLEDLILHADEYKKTYGIDVKELINLRKIELPQDAEKQLLYTKKMAIQASQLLTNKVKEKSLINHLFTSSQPMTIRAIKLIREKMIPFNTAVATY